LRILKAVEQTAEILFAQARQGVQESERNVLPDYRCFLEQTFFSGGKGVNPSREYCPNGWRNVNRRERLCKPIAAARPFEHTRIDQRSHNLFNEERISPRALDQECL